MLNTIQKKEDHFGLLTREYDEVSNDINSVQAVIEMYTNELEELDSKIEQCRREMGSNECSEGIFGTSPQPHSASACRHHQQQEGHQHRHRAQPQNQQQSGRQPVHKCRLRAHLPDNQFTLVEVRPGQKVHHVLEKKLLHRGYRMEDLAVFSVGTGNAVSWDDDAAGIALISGGDLVVEFIDQLTHRRPKHEFQRRRFFETQLCSICQKYVFFGATCKTCGLAFHQRCVSRLEKRNLQPTEEDNLIEIQRL